ncbi:TPA: ead/Ea22-like family protein [Citrobacter freundii]
MTALNKQALRTDMLIVNALGTAMQLRELQESPVAEAIFESIVENENGKEIQFERPISDLAFVATWQLEKLVEALESAEKQNSVDVQIKARLCRESNSLHDRLRAAEKRIAELEARVVMLPDRKLIQFWPGDASEFDSLGYEIAVESAIRAAGIGVKG